jgi:hypothetical protein
MEDDPRWINGIATIKEKARKKLQDKKFEEE